MLAAAPAHAQLTSTIYVSGLSNPVAFVQDPSNAAVQYVVQQRGLIRVVQNGTILPTISLNLTSSLAQDSEQGLLGPGVRGPSPLMNIDLPVQGAVVAQPFVLAGWAFDASAPSGTGISTIHVWAFQSQPWDYHLPVPAFVGVPNFGSRPDVGAAFGTQFTPSGFGLVVSGLPPGPYQLSLFGWVDAIGGFGIVRTVDVTIVSSTQLAIDLPPNFSTVNQPFHVAGWSIDTAAASGTGIDTIHVWAHPTTGGPPVFVGVPALGGIRPDVAAVFGNARYGPSGYNMAASGLAPGTYDLVVYSHSTVTNDFSASQSVRVTVR